MGRHYDWGDDNSSTDVDCVEKDDKGILRGWVNNKHAAMGFIDLTQERIKDLHIMANLNDCRGQRPAWILVYYFFKEDGSWLDAEDCRDDLSLLAHAQFLVIPVNKQCRDLLTSPAMYETFDEYEYVEWLYTKVKNMKFDPSQHTTLFRGWKYCRIPEITGKIYE
jgi:hypothetical protein